MSLLVKESPIKGKGIFTTRDIAKGEIITTFVGEVMNQEEAWRRIDHGIERNDDPLQIGDRMYLDLHQPFVYFNHSCTPNALLCETANLIALRDISTGEEIVFDYSTTVGKDSDWEMKCLCGAKNCRKVLGNVGTIPKDVLVEYRRLGGLQTFIRRQMKV